MGNPKIMLSLSRLVELTCKAGQLGGHKTLLKVSSCIILGSAIAYKEPFLTRVGADSPRLIVTS